MTKALKFPEDFIRKAHRVIPGATHWTFQYPNEDEMISVVGGGFGLQGDGVTTFEMWDTRCMEDPIGYVTEEFINQWLKGIIIKEQ